MKQLKTHSLIMVTSGTFWSMLLSSVEVAINLCVFLFIYVFIFISAFYDISVISEHCESA